MTEPVILRELPGRSNWIVAGGTRNEIKLSRPWQPPFLAIQANCPFCDPKRETARFSQMVPGWKILSCLYTPHQKHRLIVPEKCWDEEMLQNIGSFGGIRAALRMAYLAIQGDDVEIGAFIHVGQCAGQDIRHPHWHLIETPVKQSFNPSIVKFEQDVIICKTQKFVTIAGGASAGECLILPRTERLLFSWRIIDMLSRAINRIVSLGNRKFLSEQGRPPEFMVSVRISEERIIRYADYCPVLTMWGAIERVFAPLEKEAFTLPWTHKVTASFLKT